MEAKKVKVAVAAFLITLCLLGSPAGAADAPMLVPMGTAIGIQVEASGLLVVGLTEVQTDTGPHSPAWEAGIQAGDLITAVGQVSVSTYSQLQEALALTHGAVGVRYTRNGKEMQASVTPAINMEGSPELGVWLRSGLSGIGTMTFYDPESGFFGALGHAVSDADTGVALPLKTGFIGKAHVDSIQKGTHGKPGELKGSLGLEAPLGGLLRNTPQGVFGYASKETLADYGSKAVALCPMKEVRCGKACILSDAGGAVQAYAAEISRIYPDNGGTRDFLITVTDPALLALTGGIVQGMSGSPILQNGRLVGAVTHVLVGDPCKGYGIGIERMLSAGACQEDASGLAA